MNSLNRRDLLIVDDDHKMYELLERYLKPHGFVTTHAPDGAASLPMLKKSAFDLVVLDVMMPHLDGLETLRKIREFSDVPVVMLTAKGDDTDRIVGLELGADDYISKPFNPRELLARLRAVLRRYKRDADPATLGHGDLLLDVGNRSATLAGNALDLTGLEFDLLAALVGRPGRVISRERLLSLAGREDTLVGDRAVDVHISHLRKKLGDDPRKPTRIKTVRGMGYVFSEE